VVNELNDRDRLLSVLEKYLTQSITFFSPADLDNTRKYIPKQRDNSVKTPVRIYLDLKKKKKRNTEPNLESKEQVLVNWKPKEPVSFLLWVVAK